VLGDKPGGDLIVQVALLTHDAVLEHLRITTCEQHVPVIVALNHQVIGAAHVVCRPLGDDAHICGHDKALALILDAESHTLDIVLGLKCRDFQVHHPEGNFLEHRHMMIADAATDAATLQHLGHDAHRAEHATVAGAPSGIQAAHVVLVGMGKQDALDHVTAHAVTLEFSQRQVECRHILPLWVFLLAVILNGFPDAGIDQDASARGAQISTITAATTAQADKTQALAHPRVSGLGVGSIASRHAVGRVVAVHVKGDLERASIVSVSFVFVTSHSAACGLLV